MPGGKRPQAVQPAQHLPHIPDDGAGIKRQQERQPANQQKSHRRLRGPPAPPRRDTRKTPVQHIQPAGSACGYSTARRRALQPAADQRDCRRHHGALAEDAQRGACPGRGAVQERPRIIGKQRGSKVVDPAEQQAHPRHTRRDLYAFRPGHQPVQPGKQQGVQHPDGAERRKRRIADPHIPRGGKRERGHGKNACQQTARQAKNEGRTSAFGHGLTPSGCGHEATGAYSGSLQTAAGASWPRCPVSTRTPASG